MARALPWTRPIGVREVEAKMKLRLGGIHRPRTSIGAPFSTIKIYKYSSRCIMVKTTKSTVKHRKKMIFSWEIQEEQLG